MGIRPTTLAAVHTNSNTFMAEVAGAYTGKFSKPVYLQRVGLGQGRAGPQPQARYHPAKTD